MSNDPTEKTVEDYVSTVMGRIDNPTEKPTKNYDPTREKVFCKYGAPMGRGSASEVPEEKTRLHLVEMDQGGYDKGGAYWGGHMMGAYLYVAYADGFEQYRRGPDRESVKEDLLFEFPALKFYR